MEWFLKHMQTKLLRSNVDILFLFIFYKFIFRFSVYIFKSICLMLLICACVSIWHTKNIYIYAYICVYTCKCAERGTLRNTQLFAEAISGNRNQNGTSSNKRLLYNILYFAYLRCLYLILRYYIQALFIKFFFLNSKKLKLVLINASLSVFYKTLVPWDVSCKTGSGIKSIFSFT